MRHLLRFGLVLCLLAVAFGVAAAQGDAPRQYTGIDIVFLVDQSGSMGGTDYGFDREATDPLGLRFEAVQYALNTLSEYRQWAATDTEIWMSVIAFGDDTLQILDWTHIADPASTALWDQQQIELLEQLSSDTFRSLIEPDHMGNTNFIAAFMAAERAFAIRPPSEGQHLRIIVLLTDGDPCVISGEYEFTCGEPTEEQNFMGLLERHTSASFPAPDYQLYVMLFDASGDLWAKWQDIWTQIVHDPGNASHVETSEQVGAHFLNILCSVVGQIETAGVGGCSIDDIGPGENRIQVNPYLQALRISIFKSTTSPGVLAVQMPDGSMLATTDPRLTIQNVDRAIETWTIENPLPGEWLFIVGSEQDQIVVLEDILMDMRADFSGGDFALFDTATFRVTLSDQDGTALPDYSAPFGIQASGIVTLPDGSQQPAAWTEVAPGVFEGWIQTTLPGEYMVSSFVATTQMINGTPFELMAVENIGAFTVGGVNLQAGNLPSGQYYVGNAIPLTATLRDVAGESLILPNAVVNVALQGGAASAIIQLESQTDTRQYSGSVILESPGTFSLRLTATLTSETGDVYSLGRVESETFVVMVGQYIQVVIQSPDDKSSTYTTSGPLFSATGVEIEFETRLEESNQLIDFSRIVTDPENVLTVTVYDEDGRAVIEKQPIESGDQPGQYRVDLGSLDAGDYTITVQAMGDFQEPYVLNPHAASVSINITRRTNWPMVGLWGAIVVGVVSLAGTMLVKRRKRQQHPARGKLIVARVSNYGEDVTRLATIDLGAYNSNRIKLGKRALPKESGLTQMLITCDSDEMSKKERVQVVAKQGKVVVVNRIMSPGNAAKIQKQGKSQMFGDEEVGYQLMKDPDKYGFGDGYGFADGLF